MPADTRQIAAFPHAPKAWLEARFTEVATQEMVHLPFYRAHIPVNAVGLTRFEGQWFGALLTPWMLSLVILPGPDQIWPTRKIGSRLTLALPQKAMTFMVGETVDGQQYLACSLLSPLPATLDAEQAITLAQDSVRLALSLPVRSRVEVNHSLRALLRGRLAG